jgi:hypothetical protein
MGNQGRYSLNEVLGMAWWVRRYSELTMTLSLGHVLSAPSCANELARLVRKQVGVPMPVLTRWVTEQRQLDGARPDVEAYEAHVEGTQGGVSVVKIEAKLGAEMSAAQIRSFAADQLRSLKDAPPPPQGENRPGFILLVVPEGPRVEEATNLLTGMGGTLLDGGGFRLPAGEYAAGQFAAVVSWEQLIQAFTSVADGEEAADVTAFGDLHRGLHAVAMDPFDVEDLTSGWETARTDIVAVVKEVTERIFRTFRVAPDRIGSWDFNDPSYDQRRYVSRVRGHGPRTHFAVGIRELQPGHPTPVWLRYENTVGMADVRERLLNSSLTRSRISPTASTVWLPLYIPDNVTFEAAVRGVIAQIEMIDDVARGVASSARPEPRPLTPEEIRDGFPRRRRILAVGGGHVDFADGGDEYAVIVDESTLAEWFPDDDDADISELVSPYGLAFRTPADRWAYAVVRGWIATARRHHVSTGRERPPSGAISRRPRPSGTSDDAAWRLPVVAKAEPTKWGDS